MIVVPKTMTRAGLLWPDIADMEIPRATPTAGLVLHGDSSPMRLRERPHSDCVDYWRTVRRFHMASKPRGRGWKDIGYAWGVCPHGGRFEGRTWGYQQAAQEGYNSTWESCQLLVGPGDTITDVQVFGVQLLRAELMGKGMSAVIRPHSSFNSTDCPGEIVRAMIRAGTFAKEPSTKNWLEMAIQALPTISVGENSFEVKTARALLYARGMVKDVADLAMWLDNLEFDDDMEMRVERFQDRKKIDIDGIIGPITWTKLMRR